MPHDQPVIPVRSADGHAFELIHVQAARARASLLFLPGMGLSARQYIAFAQALAEKDITVYLHEYRGLGSSSLRASRTVDWGYRELLERDISAVLQRLESQPRPLPLIVGGHSLGSQLAALAAAMNPLAVSGLLLVAGGVPFWREFPTRLGLPLRIAQTVMPLIASLIGHYPGRKLGFAGREARSVMRDWSRSGRTGSYRVSGMDSDLDSAMARLETPILGIRMADDWLIPETSFRGLLDRLGKGPATSKLVDGRHADHYGWMQQPGTVVGLVDSWLNSFGSGQSSRDIS